MINNYCFVNIIFFYFLNYESQRFLKTVQPTPPTHPPAPPSVPGPAAI